MLYREAEWIREQVARLPDADLFPLLDLGSSTRDFRTRVQPHIEADVFRPLRARGTVIHSDIAAAEGVDLVGDVTDEGFRRQIAGLGVRAVMVCNLLEHVTSPQAVARCVPGLLPPGGVIIVSGPHRFPKHLDPIDNLFRPTPEEAAALFPGTELVSQVVLNEGRWGDWQSAGGVSASRLIARALVPFPRSRGWLQALPFVPYLVRRAKTFALVLRVT